MGNPISNIRRVVADAQASPRPTPLALIDPYMKALMGFIAPGAVIIGSSVTPGSDGGAAITAAEWVTAAVACIVTSAGVYAVENRPTRPTTKVPPADLP